MIGDVRFDNLVRILKGLLKKNLSNIALYSRLDSLRSSIHQVINEHPYHGPVVLYHLSQLTRNRHGFKGVFKCNVCRGSCVNVYGELVHIMQKKLIHLSPKGLSQLYSIYASCTDPNIDKFLIELELRILYFISTNCRIDNNAVIEILKKITDNLEVCTDGDYLKDLNDENVKYYLPINLIDIVTVLQTLRPSSPLYKSILELSAKLTEKIITSKEDHKSHSVCISSPENSQSHLTEPPRDRARLTEVNSGSNHVEGISSRKEIADGNIDKGSSILLNAYSTLSCIIGIYDRKGYHSIELYGLILRVLDAGLDRIDLRDMCTVLSSLLSYDLRGLDWSRIYKRLMDLVQGRENSFRSLSTIANVVFKISKDLEDHRESYKEFMEVVKSSILNKIKSVKELNDGVSFRALVMTLPILDIRVEICRLILESKITFSKTHLHPFNTFINYLIHHGHEKPVSSSFLSESKDSLGLVTDHSGILFERIRDQRPQGSLSFAVGSNGSFLEEKTLYGQIDMPYSSVMVSTIRNVMEMNANIYLSLMEGDFDGYFLSDLCYFVKLLDYLITSDIINVSAFTPFINRLNIFQTRQHLPDIDNNIIYEFLNKYKE